MARLKSRYEHVPGSFQFLQPETGQTAPFTGSFNFVVEQVYTLRRANPFLTERHGWRTDFPGIEHEVEQYNVARCIAGGWFDFILADDPAAANPTYTPPEVVQKKTHVAAVGSIKRVAAGVAVLLEWLGDGGKPVEASLAEARAATCVDCPKNDGGDFKSYFTEAISEKIRTQLEIKNDLRLKTAHDDRLTVCSACDCPLKLKVWTPLEHVLKHTSEDTKTRLDPRCWILKGT